MSEAKMNDIRVKIQFDPQTYILTRRVAMFMGLPISRFIRLAVYEKLYRHMKEGLLQHRLLAQPLTPEEKVWVINMFEKGHLI